MFCGQCGNKLETEDGKITMRYCPMCRAEIIIPEAPQKQLIRKMGNLAVKGANKLDGFIDRRLDNSIRQRMHREKCEIHATIRLTIKFGAKQIGVPAIVYFRQRTDGKVYFEYDDQVLYRLVSYEWQGSEFATVSNSNTSGQTKYKERGRTGGHRLAMGAGAAIGSVIAPGVGTVVGAAIGAGGPRRTKTRGRAVENVNETSRVEEIEKDTLAQLVIQNITTKEIYRLMIVCNREIDGMFRCLKWPEEEEFMDQMEQADIEAEYEEDSEMFSAQEELAEADYTQQLFQLKSLYDSGILTQEEFEGKKRQILGI